MKNHVWIGTFLHVLSWSGRESLVYDDDPILTKFFSYFPSCCTFKMVLTIIMMIFSHEIFQMNHFSGIVSSSSYKISHVTILFSSYFVIWFHVPAKRWMTLAHNSVINIFRCLIRLLPFHDFHDNLFKFTFTHSKLKLFELNRRQRWRQDHFPLCVLTFFQH